MPGMSAKHREIQDRILSAINSLGGGHNERAAALDATHDSEQWSGSQHIEWSEGGKLMRVSWAMYLGGLRDITTLKTEVRHGITIVTEEKFNQKKTDAP